MYDLCKSEGKHTPTFSKWPHLKAGWKACFSKKCVSFACLYHLSGMIHTDGDKGKHFPAVPRAPEKWWKKINTESAVGKVFQKMWDHLTTLQALHWSIQSILLEWDRPLSQTGCRLLRLSVSSISVKALQKQTLLPLLLFIWELWVRLNLPRTKWE